MAKKWRTLSSQEVYSTPWIRVQRDEVLNHNGKPLTFSYVELQRPSVFIVAINEHGQVYLQQNYRYPLGKSLWEIPAGFADETDLLAAAKRELIEETGLTSDEWIELGALYQAGGVASIPLTAFLAKNARQTSGKQEEDEQLDNQRFVGFDRIEAMIRRGEIIESAHIAALYLAKLHGL